MFHGINANAHTWIRFQQCIDWMKTDGLKPYVHGSRIYYALKCVWISFSFEKMFFSTLLHFKSTDSGANISILEFPSIVPSRYKESVITFLIQNEWVLLWY